MKDFIVIGTLLLTFTIVFYIVSTRIARKKQMNKRIHTFIPLPASKDEVEHVQNNNVLKRFVSSVSRFFEGIKLSSKTKQLLEQAGSPLKEEEFFVVRLLSALGSSVSLYLVGLPWYVAVPSACIGFAIPNSYMKYKGRKRVKLLSYQLVEALGTMSNSMRAGFSFLQTMQLIGKEMPDPIGPEFDRAVREIGMGIPMDDVFTSLLARLPNKELEVVVQAILAQRKSGGNLAQLMDTMEETIRGRIRVLEELKTLTAQGKLSSVIITALPLVMALYLFFVSPSYFEPMLTNPLGMFLLVSGAISLIIGWVLIQKIVRIEV
ncbi:type II secretion system F family protein [Guptibacillus hwajinpoensis]|uniref:type II secretion system F family protein n=1 Tax=Guptibacillus hwajinpoensis TaxID=208199 RepID=UPI00069F85CD|nr:type II secretion system F family protein [Alkalihalobacillus macyae]